MRHILGALSILFNFQFYRPSSIIDIGTGGGLPGIPLAVMLSESDFTLVDSIQKKITAVKDILSKLQLNNAIAIAARAEDLSTRKEYRGKFDYVIARAVAPIKELIKWGRPFLKHLDETSNPDAVNHKHVIPKGSLVLMKGGDVTDEIKQATIATHPRNISVHPIIIQRGNSFDLADKKLIIIQP